MQQYHAYVIMNDQGELYKGHTFDLDRRLSEHNQGKTSITSRGRNWRLIYFESFSTREEAIARERYFKTGAGRRYLSKKLGDRTGVS